MTRRRGATRSSHFTASRSFVEDIRDAVWISHVGDHLSGLCAGIAAFPSIRETGKAPIRRKMPGHCTVAIAELSLQEVMAGQKSVGWLSRKVVEIAFTASLRNLYSTAICT